MSRMEIENDHLMSSRIPPKHFYCFEREKENCKPGGMSWVPNPNEQSRRTTHPEMKSGGDPSGYVRRAGCPSGHLTNTM